MSRPFLLYAYPWMPYPRRVIIYLREKGIPSSLVTVVPVTDPHHGSAVPAQYPPKPPGSLPILAIPTDDGPTLPSTAENVSSGVDYIYIRQSLAILNYLDELCETGSKGFPASSQKSMHGADAMERARHTELLALADECTSIWNPIRTFGSGAGTMSIPAASKEMLRWARRNLLTIEKWWMEEDRDMAVLHQGGVALPTIAEIVLFQYLEFTVDCYGVDMTQGSGEIVKDVYGRDVVEAFPKLREFYDAFRTRNSARREMAAGEVPSEGVRARMMDWAEGVF